MAAAAVLGIIGAAAGYVYANLQPAAIGKPVRVTVPSGTGTLQIARLLEESGLVRNAAVFAGYVKYKKQGSRFQAGLYEMTPGGSLDGLIDKLNKGEVVKEEMIRFTIPEGFTIQQAADRLAELGILDAASFTKLADEPVPASVHLPEPLPAVPEAKHPLEGYLFPETYEMKKSSTGEQILERMLNEWSRKLEALPEGWQEKLKARGMTFHQLLTVASLIEKEVAVPEERPLVAGVIYNRLKQNMRLQIDATVIYALGLPIERVMEKDLEVDSPYNTYRKEGLPPGPIGSPGLSAIAAALEPAATDYMYYVTRKDGSHKHYFAVTYAEHLKNIELSKK
ncbi:endolytic transglycosylase MltG [Paenibacillus sp. CC-CFT747]|nr:endolytic transglycosylase MltG [Paenibacillus sp. CC-CFT747]